MITAVYPGSFDPVTIGHLDIIKRASSMFGKLIVAVLENNSKKPFFPLEQRVNMLKKVLGTEKNIEVVSFSGLLVDFLEQTNASVIVKGLRAVSDFEYEFQMALINKKLSSKAETVFLPASAENMFLSSSVVKEIATNGGDISSFVPPEILNEILTGINK